MFGLRKDAEGTQPLFKFIWQKLKWLELGAGQIPVLEKVHHTLVPAKPNQHRAVLIWL